MKADLNKHFSGKELTIQLAEDQSGLLLERSFDSSKHKSVTINDVEQKCGLLFMLGAGRAIVNCDKRKMIYIRFNPTTLQIRQFKTHDLMNEAAFRDSNRNPSNFDLNCNSIKSSRSMDYVRVACYDETPPDVDPGAGISAKIVVIYNLKIIEEDIQVLNEFYFELQAVHGHKIGNQLHIFLQDIENHTYAFVYDTGFDTSSGKIVKLKYSHDNSMS